MMWDDAEARALDSPPDSLDANAKTVRGWFVKRSADLKDEYLFKSDFRYISERPDMLRERVRGEDKAAEWSIGSTWSATIYWAKQ